MQITVIRQTPILEIAVAGRLDSQNSGAAQQRFDELLPTAPPRLLIDLTELEYISSAGLRVLLSAARQMRERTGKFAVSGPRQTVREIFEISGFTFIFKIFDTATEAGEFLK